MYKLDAWRPSTFVMIKTTARLMRLRASEIQDAAQTLNEQAGELIRDAWELDQLAHEMDGKTEDRLLVSSRTDDRAETDVGKASNQDKQDTGQEILAEDGPEHT